MLVSVRALQKRLRSDSYRSRSAFELNLRSAKHIVARQEGMNDIGLRLTKRVSCEEIEKETFMTVCLSLETHPRVHIRFEWDSTCDNKTR